MKITKIGHSCLLIHENHLRIVVDPGAYSQGQNHLRDIDLILITHEHPDHFDLKSLQILMKNNPGVKIITNEGVGVFLKKESIEYEILSDRKNMVWQNVMIECYGDQHAEIYPSYPRVVNTGYVIGSRFFYPGDNLTDLRRHVDILALPVAAPWLKLSEAIDYALQLKPKAVIPVHDGMLKQFGSVHTLTQTVLEANDIHFIELADGKEIEI